MFRQYLSEDLIRPVIYKLFTRLIYGTVVSLLADFFLADGVRNIKSYGFALCAVLCVLGAWLAYLRLDGMKLAKVPHFHLPKRKRPVITYGDIDDHIDDDVNDMNELSEGEKDTAVFIADVILVFVFILISVLI